MAIWLCMVNCIVCRQGRRGLGCRVTHDSAAAQGHHSACYRRWQHGDAATRLRETLHHEPVNGHVLSKRNPPDVSPTPSVLCCSVPSAGFSPTLAVNVVLQTAKQLQQVVNP
jgi:hypothetical protein